MWEFECCFHCGKNMATLKSFSTRCFLSQSDHHHVETDGDDASKSSDIG